MKIIIDTVEMLTKLSLDIVICVCELVCFCSLWFARS